MMRNGTDSHNNKIISFSQAPSNGPIKRISTFWPDIYIVSGWLVSYMKTRFRMDFQVSCGHKRHFSKIEQK